MNIQTIKKYAAASVALLISFFLLAACSAASPGDGAMERLAQDAKLEEGTAPENSYRQSAGAANNKAEKAENSDETALGKESSGEKYERKVIRNYYTEIKVEDAVKSMNRISAEAEKSGGYVSDSSLSTDYYEIHSANITVKIPLNKSDDFQNFIPGLGKILNQNSDSSDISSDYYDLESRLKNAEAQRDRLLEIMQKAETVEDIIIVREALDPVEERIEQYKGEKRYMEAQTDMVSFVFTLSEEKAAVITKKEEDNSIGWTKTVENMKNAFSNTWIGIKNFFSRLLVFFSSAILPLLIAAVFIFIIFLIIRAIVIKASRKTAKTPEELQHNYEQRLKEHKEERKQ